MLWLIFSVHSRSTFFLLSNWMKITNLNESSTTFIQVSQTSHGFYYRNQPNTTAYIIYSPIERILRAIEMAAIYSGLGSIGRLGYLWYEGSTREIWHAKHYDSCRRVGNFISARILSDRSGEGSRSLARHFTAGNPAFENNNNVVSQFQVKPLQCRLPSAVADRKRQRLYSFGTRWSLFGINARHDSTQIQEQW